MTNPRKYGVPPFRVAVVHGGPGAAGDMAPVAREWTRRHGIVEPLQRAIPLQDQIAELTRILEEHGTPPLTLIGHSWGAWLSALVAEAHPEIVEKLILVSSGPFEERYVAQLRETRRARLDERERILFDRHGFRVEWCSKTDAFDPIPSDPVPFDADLHHSVWPAAAELRRSGGLLKIMSRLRCPVVAIHGDDDPHPAEGVRDPLSSVLQDFRFVLLQNCGHTPWLERQAREEFFRILRQEVESPARQGAGIDSPLPPGASDFHRR